MNEQEKRQLIERYIDAYNASDIDGMMNTIHPEIRFENVSEGQVNATASGAYQFREMAEQSKALFSSRKQTIPQFSADDDQAYIAIQ